MSHAVNLDDDLPMKPDRKWVHMDKLEPEKLEWMRDLPLPRKKGTEKVKSDSAAVFYYLQWIYDTLGFVCVQPRQCRLGLILLVP